MLARALLLLLVLATTSRADERAYKVIVHRDNPIAGLDRDHLRDAYLRKAGRWPTGGAIHPVDLAWKYRERERFTKDVLRKTPAQLKRFRAQQIFSGKGVPPPEADSTAAMISRVLADRDAIGYIPAEADPGEARVIAIE